MGRILKFGFFAGIGIFVCYHFWPKETVHAGHKIARTTEAAARAGYNEASARK